ncbi:IclR family transcriptional regulator [Bacillus songklensis]|uniref:IclR family transcriptional regulator n=1 Tax=Bacillus songklensis TaxID=1069116 RepID=A0ABV8B7Z5_9BACI
MKESGQTVQSVERALSIMECFTLEKPQQTLGELAVQTKLSKSTIYRLLTTLARCGYIKQDEVTQKYSLGFKLFNLGAVVAGNMSLRDTSLPFMKKLCNELSETIDLNIIEEDQRVCIEMVESSEQIRNIVRVGQRNALWVGASGKVLLANLEETERRRILDEAIKLNQLQIEKSVLEKELDVIRSQGYVTSIDDRVKGSFAIASPIFNHTGKLIGGVTAAGPIHRLSEERTPFLIQQVMYTAYKISEAMGDSEAKSRYPTMVTV